MCDLPDAALRDAMQAQCVYPDWSTAFYMQAVALAKLDMHKDAADMLSEAAALEEKKQRGGTGRGSWEATLYLFLDTIGFQLIVVIVVVTKHIYGVSV